MRNSQSLERYFSLVRVLSARRILFSVVLLSFLGCILHALYTGKRLRSELPNQIIAELRESDRVGLLGKLYVLQSSEPISSIAVFDGKGRELGRWRSNVALHLSSPLVRIEIKDDSGTSWGFCELRIDLTPYLLAFLVFTMSAVFLSVFSYRSFAREGQLRAAESIAELSSVVRELGQLGEMNLTSQVRSEMTRWLKKAPPVLDETKAIIDSVLRLLTALDSRDLALRELREMESRAKAEMEKGKIAERLAHDIRSPLAALRAISNSPDISQTSEAAILHAVIRRMEEIATDLLDKGGKPASVVLQRTCLAPAIMEMVTEKHKEYSDSKSVRISADFSADSIAVECVLSPSVFKRVLSNLINNSVEAARGPICEIRVRVSICNSSAVIIVEDNGAGFSSEVLSRIGTIDHVSSKVSGHGIGLSSAVDEVESVGGSIEFSNGNMGGATVKIILPLSNDDHVWLDSIDVWSDRQVLVLDDDPSILKLWDARFSAAGIHSSQVGLFGDVRSLERYLFEMQPASPVLLTDYWLGPKELTGIEVIKSMSSPTWTKVLVTTSWWEPELQRSCQELGARILSKQLLDCIPIKVT